MFLSHPAWLWLAPIALALAVVEARRDPRQWSTGILRAVLFAAMLLALARPVVPWRDQLVTTVAVVDLSPAVSRGDLARLAARLQAGAGDIARVVAFASRAEAPAGPAVLNSTGAMEAARSRLSRPLWPDDPAGGASNLADALRLAGAQVPAHGRGRVRLFSAGANDHGDAAAEAWRLAQRGIGVEVEPVNVAATTKVIFRSVSVPATARVGETVRAVVTCESVDAGTASLSLTAGEAAPIVLPVTLAVGTNQVPIDVPLKSPGLVPLRVAFCSAGDPAPAGDVRAAVYVEPAARVLLVYDAADSTRDVDASAAALKSSLGTGASVEPLPVTGLAGRNLRDVEAVVVADVSTDHLPTGAQQALRHAVSEGTGLLFTGAARSFGPGGYNDSALASLLPVAMPQAMESVDPSTALVLIIDTSSSMQGEPIDLAKQVARLAVGHLKAHDKVGIVEFYGGRRWAAPLQTAGNLAVIHRALNRLTADGSTTLYPAVEEAAFALRNVKSRSKHVLICSDGLVEDAPFAVLVGRMAKDGITVSTVQVAPPEKGPNQMADIARWGNGRYYVSADPYGLPDISLKQPKTSMTSPLVLTTSAVRAGQDALLRGVAPDAFGSVAGYVRTETKPTADVLLKTDGGDPLLVRWRYGAGFVAALPTQLGSAMTGDLQNRPAFARVLAGLLRQLGSARGPALRVNASVRPAGLEVDITAADPPLMPDGALTVSLSGDPSQVRRTATAEAIELGHWNVLFPNVAVGAYALTASLPGNPADGHGGVAVTIPQRSPAADRALLDEIAGFGPLAARRAAERSDRATRFIDAQPFFAAASMVLLLAHVAVRRWPARDEKAGFIQ